jgi:hypothetical protein
MGVDSVELVLQGLRSCGVTHATYVACPISSGWRELALMRSLGVFDRDVLRSNYAARWETEVLRHNVADARASVSMLRKRVAGPVIDPSSFVVPGYSQADYDRLCGRILREHVAVVVAADGWEFSRGSRLELVTANRAGLPVHDATGTTLTVGEIVATADEAMRVVAEWGVDAIVGQLLPTMTIADMVVAGECSSVDASVRVMRPQGLGPRRQYDNW